MTPKMTAEQKAANEAAKRAVKQSTAKGAGAIDDTPRSVVPTTKTDNVTAEMPLADKATSDANAKRLQAPIGGHDRALMARSVRDRIETLRTLAKKNREQGHEVAAKDQERDAQILEAEQLPRYQDTQLALKGDPKSEARVQLKRTVRGQFIESARSLLDQNAAWSPNPDQDKLLRQAVNTTTDILLSVLVKCADEARTQGKLDREVDTHALVDKALSATLAQSNTPK